MEIRGGSRLSRGEVSTPRGGGGVLQPIILPNLPENHMKIKEIGPTDPSLGTVWILCDALFIFWLSLGNICEINTKTGAQQNDFNLNQSIRGILSTENALKIC